MIVLSAGIYPKNYSITQLYSWISDWNLGLFISSLTAQIVLRCLQQLYSPKYLYIGIEGKLAFGFCFKSCLVGINLRNLMVMSKILSVQNSV